MNRRAFLLGSTAALTAPLLPAIATMGIDHASGADVTVVSVKRILYVDPRLSFNGVIDAWCNDHQIFRSISDAIEYATKNPVDGDTSISMPTDFFNQITYNYKETDHV